MANTIEKIAAAGGNLITEVPSIPISRRDTVSPGDSSDKPMDKEVSASNILVDKVAPDGQSNAPVVQNTGTEELQQSGQSSIMDESSKANEAGKTLIQSQEEPQNAAGEEQTPAKNEEGKEELSVPDINKNPGEPQDVAVQAKNSSQIEEEKKNLTIFINETTTVEARNSSVRKIPEILLNVSNITLFVGDGNVTGHDAGTEKLGLEDGPSRFNTNSSPKVFDHVYLSMVNTVIVLWLILQICPMGKRIFNWVQKRTKSNKNSHRRKKQMK